MVIWRWTYGKEVWKGRVLFNDALNIFYLWVYGIGHMVKKYGKEGSVLFNDALNIFNLRLYGVGHMVKKYGKE